MNPVQWFFAVGGAVFILGALFARELPYDGMNIVALVFAIIGFAWLVPQLITWVIGRNRGT
jgi:hypothetical protein